MTSYTHWPLAYLLVIVAAVQCAVSIKIQNRLCADSDYTPDPDCHHFWRCSEGRAFKFQCAAGLHFNPSLNVCDWPQRSGCKGANVSSSTTLPYLTWKPPISTPRPFNRNPWQRTLPPRGASGWSPRNTWRSSWRGGQVKRGDRGNQDSNDRGNQDSNDRGNQDSNRGSTFFGNREGQGFRVSQNTQRYNRGYGSGPSHDSGPTRHSSGRDYQVGRGYQSGTQYTNQGWRQYDNGYYDQFKGAQSNRYRGSTGYNALNNLFNPPSSSHSGVAGIAERPAWHTPGKAVGGVWGGYGYGGVPFSNQPLPWLSRPYAPARGGGPEYYGPSGYRQQGLPLAPFSGGGFPGPLGYGNPSIYRQYQPRLTSQVFGGNALSRSSINGNPSVYQQFQGPPSSQLTEGNAQRSLIDSEPRLYRQFQGPPSSQNNAPRSLIDNKPPLYRPFQGPLSSQLLGGNVQSGVPAYNSFFPPQPLGQLGSSPIAGPVGPGPYRRPGVFGPKTFYGQVPAANQGLLQNVQQPRKNMGRREVTLGKPSVSVTGLGRAFIPVLQNDPQLARLLAPNGQYLQVNPLPQARPYLLPDPGWYVGPSGQGPGPGQVGGTGGWVDGSPHVAYPEDSLRKFLLPVRLVTPSTTPATPPTTIPTTTTTTTTTTSTATAITSSSVPPRHLFYLSPLLPSSLPLPNFGHLISTSVSTSNVPLPRAGTLGAEDGSWLTLSLLNDLLQTSESPGLPLSLPVPSGLDPLSFSADPNTRCKTTHSQQTITLGVLQKSGQALTEPKCSAFGQLINSFVSVYLENLGDQTGGTCVLQIPQIQVLCNTGSLTTNNSTRLSQSQNIGNGGLPR